MNACVLLGVLLSACGAKTALLAEDEPRDDGGPVGHCRPVSETCNGIDDDCDGSIDEGLPLAVLGDPVVLRSPEETRTGDCRYCDQALRAEVITVGEELLVVWQMNFLFLDPAPNTFARRVDRRGDPVEPAWLWTGHLTTMSLELVRMPDGRRALTFCERVDEAHDNDDYPSLLQIDDEGRAVGELVRVSNARCLAEGARAGSTAMRTLMAYAAEPDEVEIAIVTADLHTSLLPMGSGSDVALATSSSGALASWIGWTPTPSGPTAWSWTLQALDALGAPRGAPMRLPVEDGAPGLPLPRGEGWWIVEAGELALTVRPLSPEGAPSGERRPIGGGDGADWVRGVGLPDERLVLVAQRAGGEREERWVRTDVYLIGLEGDVESTWTSDELGEPTWHSPTLRAIDGRVALVYTVDVGSDHGNEVRLRILACEP